jgi:hypothetical protein
MVIRFFSFYSAGFAIAGEIPNLDFGFAINRQSQGLGIGIGTLIDLGNIGKDGIG